MTPSLIDAFGALVTPDLVKRISASLGESEGATSATLAAAAPAVLAGMLGKTKDSGAMGLLEGLLNDKANDGGLVNNLGGLVGGSSPMASLGSTMLSQVFGGQLGSIAGVLGSLGGVKPSSASSLLGMAAPILMSLLGSRMKSSGMGLASLLDGQRQSIQAAVPPGLASALGALSMPSMPSMPSAGHAAAHVSKAAAEVSSSGINPIAALLGAIVIGGALWFLWDRMGDRAPVTTSAPTITQPAPMAAPAPVPDPAPVEIAGRASFPANGFESRLVGFIEGAAPVDQTTWFDFDRVLFDTAKATIRPESDEQITHTASVLKAFPNVRLKVGGYTDNVGNAAANQALSQARAEAVMQAIVAKGIEAARLEAEGYGDQHPVADNATAEGRQKNRRVSVRVTQK